MIATVFTYLELNGILRATGPFYDSYKVKLNRPLEAVCAGFDPARAAFLQDLFATAKPGRLWSQLNPGESAAALSQPRGRVTAAIGYLEEKGELTVQTTGLRHGYRLQGAVPDPGELTGTLQKTFAERESRDIARLRRVLAYAEQKSCLTRHLLDYFGEKSASDCKRLQPVPKRRGAPPAAHRPPGNRVPPQPRSRAGLGPRTIRLSRILGASWPASFAASPAPPPPAPS